MRNDLSLEQFSGPLDLLLQLIEKNELEITDIAIAQVTEQFLAYLEEVEEIQPEELADFLVIATRLLLLKSQALLPYLYPEDDEEPDPGELAAQLKMYKQYAEATERLSEHIVENHFLFPKKKARIKQQEVAFRPPEKFGTDELHSFFVTVLQRLEPVVRIPKAAIQKVVTLREKLTQIRGLLDKFDSLDFQELLADTNDSGEIVVTFLALLEMSKQQSIALNQDSAFSSITVQKI